MIRLAFLSVADTAIVQLQERAGAGLGPARMNLPGRAEGNWGWRSTRARSMDMRETTLAELTAVYSRWNGAIPDGKDPRRNSRRPDRKRPS